MSGNKTRKWAEEVDVCLTENEQGRYVIPINLDFDGTCVFHHYPYVGDDVPHCVETLKRWQEKYNIGIILHTSRGEESEVKAALNWFKEHDICLWGLGKNPTQDSWCLSNKSYGFFIDDMCASMPLLKVKGERPCVDWLKLAEIFEPRLEEMAN